jgi:hypothetical protein
VKKMTKNGKNGKKERKEIIAQYRVFAVQEGEEQSYWTRIGTAFQYETGNIVVLLNALPLNGKLTLLPAEEEAAEEEEDDIRPRRK